MQFDHNYLVEQINKEGQIVASEEDLCAKLSPKDGSAPKIENRTILSAYSPLRLKLGEHMRLDHTIFLFGNGSSIYAGSQDTRAFSLADYGKIEAFKSISDIITTVSSLSGIENQLNALITIQSYYNITHDPKEEQITSLISQVKQQLINVKLFMKNHMVL